MSTCCNYFIQCTDGEIINRFTNGQNWLKTVFGDFIPSEKDCPEKYRWTEDCMCEQDEDFPYLNWTDWMFDNLGFRNAYDFYVKDNTVWFDTKWGTAFPQGMLELLHKKFPHILFTVGCWFIDGDTLTVYAHDYFGYNIVENMCVECNDYVSENSNYDWKMNGWGDRGHVYSKHIRSLVDERLGDPRAGTSWIFDMMHMEKPGQIYSS